MQRTGRRRSPRSNLHVTSVDPIEEASSFCRLKKDKRGFKVRFIDDYIGHGVFTEEAFPAGSFLLEYAGEHISSTEAAKRMEKYPPEYGSFLFFHGRKCIDATFSEKKGRMVNDERRTKANCVIKAVNVDGNIHICLFAKQDIRFGDELRYDYGEPGLPWRKQKSGDKGHGLNVAVNTDLIQKTVVTGDDAGRRGAGACAVEQGAKTKAGKQPGREQILAVKEASNGDIPEISKDKQGQIGDASINIIHRPLTEGGIDPGGPATLDSDTGADVEQGAKTKAGEQPGRENILAVTEVSNGDIPEMSRDKQIQKGDRSINIIKRPMTEEWSDLGGSATLDINHDSSTGADGKQPGREQMLAVTEVSNGDNPETSKDKQRQKGDGSINIIQRPLSEEGSDLVRSVTLDMNHDYGTGADVEQGAKTKAGEQLGREQILAVTEASNGDIPETSKDKQNGSASLDMNHNSGTGTDEKQPGREEILAVTEASNGDIPQTSKDKQRQKHDWSIKIIQRPLTEKGSDPGGSATLDMNHDSGTGADGKQPGREHMLVVTEASNGDIPETSREEQSQEGYGSINIIHWPLTEEGSDLGGIVTLDMNHDSGTGADVDQGAKTEAGKPLGSKQILAVTGSRNGDILETLPGPSCRKMKRKQRQKTNATIIINQRSVTEDVINLGVPANLDLSHDFGCSADDVEQGDVTRAWHHQEDEEIMEVTEAGNNQTLDTLLGPSCLKKKEMQGRKSHVVININKMLMTEDGIDLECPATLDTSSSANVDHGFFTKATNRLGRVEMRAVTEASNGDILEAIKDKQRRKGDGSINIIQRPLTEGGIDLGEPANMDSSTGADVEQGPRTKAGKPLGRKEILTATGSRNGDMLETLPGLSCRKMKGKQRQITNATINTTQRPVTEDVINLGVPANLDLSQDFGCSVDDVERGDMIEAGNHQGEEEIMEVTEAGNRETLDTLLGPSCRKEKERQGKRSNMVINFEKILVTEDGIDLESPATLDTSGSADVVHGVLTKARNRLGRVEMMAVTEASNGDILESIIKDKRGQKDDGSINIIQTPLTEEGIDLEWPAILDWITGADVEQGPRTKAGELLGRKQILVVTGSRCGDILETLTGPSCRTMKAKQRQKTNATTNINQGPVTEDVINLGVTTNLDLSQDFGCSADDVEQGDVTRAGNHQGEEEIMEVTEAGNSETLDTLLGPSCRKKKRQGKKSNIVIKPRKIPLSNDEIDLESHATLDTGADVEQGAKTKAGEQLGREQMLAVTEASNEDIPEISKDKQSGAASLDMNHNSGTGADVEQGAKTKAGEQLGREQILAVTGSRNGHMLETLPSLSCRKLKEKQRQITNATIITNQRLVTEHLGVPTNLDLRQDIGRSADDVEQRDMTGAGNHQEEEEIMEVREAGNRGTLDTLLGPSCRKKKEKQGGKSNMVINFEKILVTEDGIDLESPATLNTSSSADVVHGVSTKARNRLGRVEMMAVTEASNGDILEAIKDKRGQKDDGSINIIQTPLTEGGIDLGEPATMDLSTGADVEQGPRTKAGEHSRRAQNLAVTESRNGNMIEALPDLSCRKMEGKQRHKCNVVNHSSVQSKDYQAITLLSNMSGRFTCIPDMDCYSPDPSCSLVTPVNLDSTSSADTFRDIPNLPVECPDKLGVTERMRTRNHEAPSMVEEYVSDSSNDAADPDYFVEAISEPDSDGSDSDKSEEIPVVWPQENRAEVTSSTPVNLDSTSSADTFRDIPNLPVECPDKLGVTERVRTRNHEAPSMVEEYVSDSSDDAADPDYFVEATSEPDSDGSDSDKSEEIPVVWPQENRAEVTSSTPETPESPKYVRPRRPCPFCGKFQTRLTRHITLMHKNLKEVSEAMDVPEEERLAVFSKMRKQGILNENKKQTEQKNPVYQQERKPRKTSSRVVMCGNCQGFYHSRFVSRHRKRCLAVSCEAGVSVPLSVLSRLDENTDGFVAEILGKMRDDTVGIICKNDPAINLVGKRLWMKNRLKQDKKEEVRKQVMTAMRRLGCLFQAFVAQQEELGPIVCDGAEATAADMFVRNNFKHLEQAIHQCTTTGNGNSLDELKYGLKTGLYYLIKKSSKYLKGTYLIDDADNKAEAVDKFLHVFELNHDALFGDAAYAMQKVRNEKLRRPEVLPLEADVKKVREYSIRRMEAMVGDTFGVLDSHAYIEMRDLAVSRLTLFNARRGGEPCRLRIKEWIDAEQNVWVTDESIQQLDEPLDRYFARSLKVAYQTGKGNKHLVPVLMPEDILSPLRKLADNEVRSLAGISSKNSYLFPSSQGSETHVSGWHAFHRVCEKIDLERPELLTATKNRHRVSTQYAIMEVPESERRFFYDHMGHSADMNADIYQAPLALMELLKVGRPLSRIDSEQLKSATSSGTSAADRCDSASTSQKKQDCQLPGVASEENSGQRHTRKRKDTCQDNQTRASGANDVSSSQDQQENLPAVASEENNRQRRTRRRKDACQDSPQTSAAGATDVSSQDQQENLPGVSGAQRKRQYSSDSDDVDENTVRRKKGRKYVKWSGADADLVKEAFKAYINGEKGNKLPGQQEIVQFKEREGMIHDWMTIKTKVNNERVKLRRLAEERRRRMNIQGPGQD